MALSKCPPQRCLIGRYDHGVRGLNRRRGGDDGEMAPPTGGGANRCGVGGEGDFGFVICDFILSDGYISGVGGPRVEPGAKRCGGPGGARAVFLWF